MLEIRSYKRLEKCKITFGLNTSFSFKNKRKSENREKSFWFNLISNAVVSSNLLILYNGRMLTGEINTLNIPLPLDWCRFSLPSPKDPVRPFYCFLEQDEVLLALLQKTWEICYFKRGTHLEKEETLFIHQRSWFQEDLLLMSDTNLDWKIKFYANKLHKRSNQKPLWMTKGDRQKKLFTDYQKGHQNTSRQGRMLQSCRIWKRGEAVEKREGETCWWKRSRWFPSDCREPKWEHYNSRVSHLLPPSPCLISFSQLPSSLPCLQRRAWMWIWRCNSELQEESSWGRP